MRVTFRLSLHVVDCLVQIWHVEVMSPYSKRDISTRACYPHGIYPRDAEAFHMLCRVDSNMSGNGTSPRRNGMSRASPDAGRRCNTPVSRTLRSATP